MRKFPVKKNSQLSLNFKVKLIISVRCTFIIEESALKSFVVNWCVNYAEHFEFNYFEVTYYIVEHNFITKWGNNITKWDRYYKVGQHKREVLGCKIMWLEKHCCLKTGIQKSRLRLFKNKPCFNFKISINIMPVHSEILSSNGSIASTEMIWWFYLTTVGNFTVTTKMSTNKFRADFFLKDIFITEKRIKFTRWPEIFCEVLKLSNA